jgi:hypothetical protein
VRGFGFRERLRIGNHRVQLVFGDGALVVTQLGGADPIADVDPASWGGTAINLD